MHILLEYIYIYNEIQSLDDQHTEPQPNKYQPKVMNDEILVVSSDSENEMLQRKHQIVKKTKVSKVIINLLML